MTDNSIAQDIYASRLSQELGVEKSTIATRIESIKKRMNYNKRKEKFDKLQRSTVTQTVRETAQSGKPLRVIKAQKIIISSLIRNPDFLSIASSKLTKEDFTVGSTSRLFEVISKKIEDGDSLEFSCFANELSNEEMSFLVGLCKKSEELPATR